ncbi:MAG: hypothetical protein HFH41_10400 [Lachnospiraceae bacterium]|nr:hypothetical protein [Lachnospiraceae bacterium]
MRGNLTTDSEKKKRRQLQYIFKKLFEYEVITLEEYSKAMQTVNGGN